MAENGRFCGFSRSSLNWPTACQCGQKRFPFECSRFDLHHERGVSNGGDVSTLLSLEFSDSAKNLPCIHLLMF